MVVYYNSESGGGGLFNVIVKVIMEDCRCCFNVIVKVMVV